MPLSTLHPKYKRQAREAHEATLAWVNAQREQMGHEPLGDLVPGERGTCADCPVARSLAHATSLDARTTFASTAITNFHLRGTKAYASQLHHPPQVKDFISLFDRGWLPELEL